jgi:YaiO family outer membrane protein
VELWDRHPGRAEALAVSALSRQRRETSLMIAQVRALRAQNHNREALDVVRNILDMEPSNEEALSLDRTIKEELQQWSTSFSHTSDWFKGGIGAWNEYDVTLKRATYLGSVSATFSRADRFGLHSNFSEVTWYPRIRSGTYGYVGFGWSSDGTLFPYYRLGAEIFQTLPHGMEVSGGYRRFGFSSATDMYTGSLGKYYSNWLFTGRFFLTPDALGATHSESITARRYFGDRGDYIGLRVGTGPSPFDPRSSYDLQNLSASSGYIDMQKTFGRHWVWTGLFGVAVEERPYRVGVDQFTLETTLNYRF